MPDSRYRCGVNAIASRLPLALVLALLAAATASSQAAQDNIFPDIVYPTPPDRTVANTDQIRKVAAALGRACPEHSAVAWHRTQPAAALQQLSRDMTGKLAAFEITNSDAALPGPPAPGSRRLILAQTRTGRVPFTLLWSAGDQEVSLQICGSRQPAAGRSDNFDKCVDTAPRPMQPLSADCLKRPSADM
jgi:hypothetical protein